MDHNLIDQKLLALLRIPADQRTAENLTEALQSIATAASVETPVIVPDTDLQHLINLHREQIKLSYYSELLLPVLGYSAYDASIYSTTADYGKRADISVIFSTTNSSASAGGLPTLIGRGETAQAALRDLHAIAKREQAA